MTIETSGVEHQISAFFYTIITLAGAKIASDIIKGVWIFANRHKGPTGEQFRELINSLNMVKSSLDKEVGLREKMSKDLRRCFLFLKVIAGDKWPKYKKEVENIENGENFN